MTLEITASKASLFMFRVTPTGFSTLLHDLCQNSDIWGLLWHIGGGGYSSISRRNKGRA